MAKGNTPMGTFIAPPPAGKTTTPGVNLARKTERPQGGTGVPIQASAVLYGNNIAVTKKRKTKNLNGLKKKCILAGRGR